MGSHENIFFSARLVVSRLLIEALSRPSTTLFFRRHTYRNERHRVEIGSALNLHSSIVLPKPLYLMHFQSAVDQHHGEVRSVERVVCQSQLETLELEPRHLAGEATSVESLRMQLRSCSWCRPLAGPAPERALSDHWATSSLAISLATIASRVMPSRPRSGPHPRQSPFQSGTLA